MNVLAALVGQYRAALNMLRQAIESCPADLWDGGGDPVPFWRVVYHTIYGTHLYLHNDESSFRPWQKHREGHQELPWPESAANPVADPYSKSEMLEYWALITDGLDGAINRLDLDAAECGFPWHKTQSKLEHQIHNIRHIQHHTAILSARLRRAAGVDVRWVRSREEVYQA